MPNENLKPIYFDIETYNLIEFYAKQKNLTASEYMKLMFIFCNPEFDEELEKRKDARKIEPN